MANVDKGKVPVTIISGFLGSGKSTLLNYILEANHGKRIAVIENEFGDEKGIEKLIARNGEGDKVSLGDIFVELSNGCICCTVRDDLVTTLEALLEKRDRFDYIMIETTGVADPGPLAGIFWLDEELESQLFLDGIVTVVDLKNLIRHLDDPNKQVEDGKSFVNEARKQLAYADRILLNKIDLIENEQDLQQVKQRVVEINPLAKILPSTYSKVNLDDILNVRGYESGDYVIRKENPLQAELLKLESTISYGDKKDEGGREENCSHCEDNKPCTTHSKRHDTSVRAQVARTSKPLNLKNFQRWLGELLWEKQGDRPEELQIFRVKGCVFVDGSPNVHVVQGVHETFEITETKETWGSDAFPEPKSRIVFIGRNIDIDQLTQQINEIDQD